MIQFDDDLFRRLVANLAAHEVQEYTGEGLRRAAVAYAEDTRRTRKLFAHFGLDTPLRSLHAHNEVARTREVLERIDAGDLVAVVSDAGTPSVSDPGARLVEAAVAAGAAVTAIPGPSAVLAALAVSGLHTDAFVFLGFAPRKGPMRRRWMARVARSDVTVVVFEAPRRLPALLQELADAGIGDRKCAVCRELTKLHEEVRRGTVGTLADYYTDRTVRGEVTLVIEGTDAGEEGPVSGPELEALGRRVAARMAGIGMSTKEIARSLRDDVGLPRNLAYEIGLEAAGSGD